MPMLRLVYFSQNQIDPARGSVVRVLSQILAASNCNNRLNDITGALVFDEQWFIQALEGERAAVWATFDRLREDERHSDVVVAEAVDLKARMFGNWWMGLATRGAATESAFQPFLRNGRLDPPAMSATDMLSLMEALARTGLRRELLVSQPV